MDNILKSVKTNFWQVINDNTIVIPQIQRDYAQGRTDMDVVRIRTNILDRFYHAIINPEIPENLVDIDFIYGYNSGCEFIPLDGQQRLTTLFLIHWYISKRAEIDEERLKEFRYETRQSSTDFCEIIFNIDFPFKEENNIKDWSLNQRWFYHSWQKDPTINGMLTMMQSIHEKFRDCNFPQLWNNIVEHNPITFNFLSIENTGMTDELYIKMNSRGKSLTRFENFKVWFEKKYPDNKEWSDKIDNDWTNLFWKYKAAFKAKNSLDNAIDDEFMQFINGMCMFTLGGHKGDKIVLEKGDAKVEYEKFKIVQHFANTSDISLAEYEKYNLFSNEKEEIARIIQTLDWFCKHDEEFRDMVKGITFWNGKTVFEAFISSTTTYPERVQFYAIVHYITYTSKVEINKDSFRQWMRVTRNLIENSLIDSPERFINAIEVIDNIKENCIDIIEYLKSQPKISFFLQSQVEEEIKKAEIIKSDLNWLSEIEDAENHELFRGSISFLLYDNITINDFIKYRNIAKDIFNKDGSKYKKNYTLMRSVLALSDISSGILLLDNGANWRTQLKRKVIQTPILEVIKKLDASTVYLDVLNTIIDEYDNQDVLWKYYLVKNSVLLSHSSETGLLKEYWGLYYLYNKSTWIRNDNQILLSNRRNEIVSLFLERLNLDLYRTGDWWVKKDLATGQTFYRGAHIWMSKPIDNYKLWFNFTGDHVIVGFYKDDKNRIDIAENELEKDEDWLVCKKFWNYPTKEEEMEAWVENVISEIPAIEALAKMKINNIITEDVIK